MHRVSMLVRALYPFRSTSANELSIHTRYPAPRPDRGRVQTTHRPLTGACWGDCGWVRVATLDGLREGYVPAGYVVLDKDDVRLNEQRQAERAEFLTSAGAA